MLFNRFYYLAKPWVPWRLRMAVRRAFAQRKRARHREVWPILESAAAVPDSWPGWPGGSDFSLVLTHDVESERGVDRCRLLAELEMELGFRSSFNFIPRGEYAVPAELRQWLASRGFEVGVHDLQHDGWLYSSRRAFTRNAASINRYLKEWEACGFRSGFMLHNLEWLHELNICYDSSTFDTDPFEPQPDGVGTIFPFWKSAAEPGRRGYMELPCTLPQDSTLFLLLKERDIGIWKEKLHWIARHGGMAMLNVHPDYVSAKGAPVEGRTYPIERYREFLEFVRSSFAGRYWNALPREVAGYCEPLQRQPDAGKRPESQALVPELAGEPALELSGKRAAVLLYSHYPSDPRPRRAAEAMASAGMEVDLICLQEKDELRRERINGVEVLRLPVQKKRQSKLNYVFQYGAFLTACLGILAQRSLRRRYDVVHVHNMPDVLVFSALIPRVLGARVILDLHDPMPELMTSIYGLPDGNRLVRLLKRLERSSIAFADLVLTPNQAFRDLFVSRGCPADRIEIIMNSPQAEIFDPRRFGQAVGAAEQGRPFRIMHHGFLAERHGLSTALEAVALVRKRLPNIEFHLYGRRTDYMDAVERQVRQLQLEDVFFYHGHQSQENIAEAILSVDLGLIPNRRNSFTEINMPTRIFEYVAMGKPVIVPDTRGIRDYFDETSAFFFQPDDAANLAEVILGIHERPGKAATVLEQARVVYGHHSWPIERAKFLDRVSTLLKSPRKSASRPIADASVEKHEAAAARPPETRPAVLR